MTLFTSLTNAPASTQQVALSNHEQNSVASAAPDTPEDPSNAVVETTHANNNWPVEITHTNNQPTAENPQPHVLHRLQATRARVIYIQCIVNTHSFKPSATPLLLRPQHNSTQETYEEDKPCSSTTSVRKNSQVIQTKSAQTQVAQTQVAPIRARLFRNVSSASSKRS